MSLVFTNAIAFDNHLDVLHTILRSHIEAAIIDGIT